MAATNTVLAEKQSPAALSNAYHWALGGSRFGVDTHPHVAQSTGKKSMSAIIWSHLIYGFTSVRPQVPADIVLDRKSVV